ncbi:MAG: hypothetical protein ACQR33_01405 [Candidatus Saccharibacteria bacterium]
METERLELPVEDFSVENLLGQLASYAETSEKLNESEKLERFMQISVASEMLASQLGDAGNKLIREVETYLASNEARDLLKFQDIMQQLGDLCLDHASGHAQAETSAMEASGHAGGGHGDNHDHSHRSDGSAKQRSSKAKAKKRPPTLFEYFVKHKASSKRVATTKYNRYIA